MVTMQELQHRGFFKVNVEEEKAAAEEEEYKYCLLILTGGFLCYRQTSITTPLTGAVELNVFRRVEVGIMCYTASPSLPAEDAINRL